jgi:allantoin racemase
MRILWQGFVDPAVHSPYVDRLTAYLRRLADPGTEFEFRGLTPPDRFLHRITETRCAVQAVAGVIEAEREGFDAVIVGHFQDSGLWEARSAVEIPVVGLGESSMLHACTLGRRIGLITISPAFISWHEEQVIGYGLGDRIVGVRAMDTDVDLYMRAFEEPDAYAEVRRQFVEQARPLVDRAVEVIIPAGGLPALLFSEERGFEIDGAVVLNPTPVSARQAQTAVQLRELNDTAPSRRSTFALPSNDARREYLEQVGGHVSVP